MRKTIIISMLFCVSIACKAQSRYCMTYEDFVKGNWVTVDTFIVTKRTKTEKFMVGGSDYRDVIPILKKSGLIELQEVGDSD